MDAEAREESPAALLDELRAHPEWAEPRRDAVLDRLVARFAADELVATVLGRLGDLSGGDAEAMLRLVEANPRPPLLRALADALAAQPELAPERAWEALAVLDAVGALGDHPALIERWDELNEALDETGSIEELVEQIEDDPDGIWLALQGLTAVEPEVRPGIIKGLARVPLGPGLTEFLRLLAYSHDEPTRSAALAALAADEGGQPALREVWSDLAACHHESAVVESARRRLGAGTTDAGLPVPVSRLAPELVRSLVTAVDGRGQGTIVLSASRGGNRATAAFLCDVETGVVEIAGQFEPESAQADLAFDEFVDRTDRDVIAGAGDLATRLLAGSILLSGAGSPPSWRFWVEATAGQLTPRPFRAGFPGWGAVGLSQAETVERSRWVLDACPDWLDASPLTYQLAEEILLREGQSPPDPGRDAGAYRYLFEHRLHGRLEVYRRMLLWMAWFWRESGDDRLARAALELDAQLADAPNVVPGHPFTVALSTRSLAAAQEEIRQSSRR